MKEGGLPETRLCPQKCWKSTTAMEVELENVLSEGQDHAGDPPEAESASPELMRLAAEQADAVRSSFEAPQ